MGTLESGGVCRADLGGNGEHAHAALVGGQMDGRAYRALVYAWRDGWIFLERRGGGGGRCSPAQEISKHD